MIKMINRINRIQGQLNGVIKMMEEEKIVKMSLLKSVHQKFNPTFDGDYH